MLLLLVQNNEAGVAGGKHRAAGADDDLRVAVFDPLPLIVPFGSGQAAVQHRHLSAKIGRQDAQQLGGQGDFRYQKHGGFAAFQTGLNQADVDGGFARAGDAVKQRHAGSFLPHLRVQPFKAGLLLPVQYQRAVQLGGPDFPAAQNRTFRQGQVAQTFQPVHRGGGRAGKIAQVLHRHAAHAAKQLQRLFLHGGGFGPFFGVGHGLLRRDGKGGDSFGFVVGLSQIVRLRGHPLFPGQVGQHLGKSILIGNQISEGVLLRLPA